MSHPREAEEELTQLVRNLARGRPDADVRLLPYLLRELKVIAQAHLRTQRPGHSLQASALVNEAYLKLFDRGGLDIEDRVHFFALAAKAMRQVLVDHARQKKTVKRGGDRDALSLSSTTVPGAAGVDIDALDLNMVLEELSALDERQGRVVELRYFGGLEVEEVAQVLSVSKTTVEREWRVARAWLGSRLKREQRG